MTLAEKAAELARLEGTGVRESPPGSNRGPKIDAWVKGGGGLDQPPPEKGKTNRGHPYCASFVSYVVIQATRDVGGPPQFRPGASVLKLKERNANLLLEAPPVGEWAVFLILHADGTGHCGFGRADVSGRLETREANTGPGPAVPAKDREGDGYYERTDRKVSDCSGFLRIA